MKVTESSRQMFGRYWSFDCLGRGGMGEVWSAWDQTLDRPVAIKTPLPDIARDPSFAKRFRVEAINMARMGAHPNGVVVYDHHDEAESLAIVMEILPGCALDEVLQYVRRLDSIQFRAVMSQLISAFGYAHEQKIIHRDIKPSNIMLTESGAVKVMDFGLSRVQDSNRLSRKSQTVGTPVYMAPEQFLHKNCDNRTDIYSLGALLYELIAGCSPFEEFSDQAYPLMNAHVNTPPPPLGRFVDNVEPSIEAAVMRALAKEPAARFGSMQEFGQALGAMPTQSEAFLVVSKLVKATPSPRPPRIPVTGDYIKGLSDRWLAEKDSAQGRKKRPRKYWPGGQIYPADWFRRNAPAISLSVAALVAAVTFGSIVAGWFTQTPPAKAPSTAPTIIHPQAQRPLPSPEASVSQPLQKFNQTASTAGTSPLPVTPVVPQPAPSTAAPPSIAPPPPVIPPASIEPQQPPSSAAPSPIAVPPSLLPPVDVTPPAPKAPDDKFEVTGEPSCLAVLRKATNASLKLVDLPGRPKHGSAQIGCGSDPNQVRYTPKNGFTGSDQLTYEVEDARGRRVVAAVTVVVILPPPPQVQDNHWDIPDAHEPAKASKTPEIVEHNLNLTQLMKVDIQKSLSVLHYYTGDSDGDFGPRTRDGIKAYQRAKGLVATGYMDEGTRESLLDEAREPLRRQHTHVNDHHESASNQNSDITHNDSSTSLGRHSASLVRCYLPSHEVQDMDLDSCKNLYKGAPMR